MQPKKTEVNGKKEFSWKFFFFIPGDWPFIILVLWQVLVRAQNPGLMSDDSGEMAASAYRLGLSHPPGYPLFNLLGHIFSWMPVGTVAFRLNLFSEFLVLISLAIILMICRGIVLRSTAPVLGRGVESLLLITAGIIFVSCRSVFAQSLTAKGCIYTLTLLIISTIIGLRFLDVTASSLKYLFLTVFLWALGMCNHWQTMIFFVPFLINWIYENKNILKARTLLFLISMVLICLSVYLYLPLRASLNCDPSWGYPINLPLFNWVVFRKLVSGLEPWLQNRTFYLASISEMLNVVINYWFPGFIILVFLGARNLWGYEKRLTLSILLVFGPIFVGIFLIHEEKNIYLLHAYLVPLAGLIMLMGFCGYRSIVIMANNQILQHMITLLIFLCVISWFNHIYYIENKRSYLLAEDFGENVMKSLPKNSILLAEGDHYVMSIWYESFVNHRRMDLIFEPSVFLLHGWGWKQLGDQSKDLKLVVASTPLFEDRLKDLTLFPMSHPLYYSLSRNDMKAALCQLPGYWEPNGLTYKYEISDENKEMVKKKLIEKIKAQRLRGLDNGFSQVLDPSSNVILSYYQSYSLIN